MFPEDLKRRLKHVHAFVVSPFKRNDVSQLDLEGLRGNLSYMVDRGVRVLCLGGGTGEVNALTAEELIRMTEVGLEVAGDRTLVIPALPGNLGMSLELAPRYERMGVSVVLAMAPFVRDQTPEDLEGVFNYYQLLSRASGLALMPYNTQAWSASFFQRLSEVEAIIGIKDPCAVPHNLFRAIQLLGDRFVWIGNKRHDPGVLHFRFQAGIDGFTAGLINFAPEFFVDLFDSALREDWERMIRIQAQLAPLERLRMVYAESVIKTGLDLLGLAGGPVRPPRTDIDDAGRRCVREEMVKLGLDLV